MPENPTWSELGKLMEEFFSPYKITDTHVHIGESIDGHVHTLNDLDQYRALGFDEFVVFPFDEPGSRDTIPFYREANERIACINSPGVIKFMRLHPENFKSVADARKEIEYWRSYGLCGVKLNPGIRGDKYNISKIRDIVRAAGKLSVPVIVHTSDNDGFSSGMELAKIAKENPYTNIIAGHMFKTDTAPLKFVKKEKIDNIYFDISVSLEASIENFSYALQNLGSERILFGSDANYRDPAVNMLKLYKLAHSERFRQYMGYSDMVNILSSNIHRLL